MSIPLLLFKSKKTLSNHSYIPNIASKNKNSPFCNWHDLCWISEQEEQTRHIHKEKPLPRNRDPPPQRTVHANKTPALPVLSLASYATQKQHPPPLRTPLYTKGHYLYHPFTHLTLQVSPAWIAHSNQRELLYEICMEWKLHHIFSSRRFKSQTTLRLFNGSLCAWYWRLS